MKTLYYGGPILTMEAPMYAEALLIRDNVVAAVGPLLELLPNAGDAREVDLQGKALLPAFIDPHSHLSAAANELLQAPLEEARNFDELADLLSDYISTHHIPKGAWVLGKGYDHNDLAEGCHPTRAVLDRAAPDNPVVIQHKSSHMGVFNTAALDLLEVGPDAPSFNGGSIARENGIPTGYMEENSFTHYLEQVPMPDLDSLLAAYRQTQLDYAAQGIATAQEGMMNKQLIPLYQALVDGGSLILDVVGYPGLKEWDPISKAFPRSVNRYDHNFKLGGIKLFLDGSPQGRTAWMRTPYLGEDPEDRGYGTMSDQDLRDALRFAYDRRLQPLAHCNGDAAAAQYLAAIAELEAVHPDFRDLRPVMIHAQLLDLDQMDEVARLGVIPSFFVAHVYHWGDVHIKNFGPERAGRISPARAALDRDIPFTFHQDAPVIRPNMLETIWAAVNRRTKKGVCLGPEQRVTTAAALRAVTVNAAYQYFEETYKGSLSPGKVADLVILSDDPLRVPPETLRDIRVLETVKNSKTIFRAK